MPFILVVVQTGKKSRGKFSRSSYAAINVMPEGGGGGGGGEPRDEVGTLIVRARPMLPPGLGSLNDA